MSWKKHRMSACAVALVAFGVLSARAEGDGVVARIGDTEYTDLQEAFKKVATGQTITMVSDVSYENITDSTFLTLAAGKQVTFDLNGKTVYGENSIENATVMLEVDGDLTIDDTSEGKTGRFAVKPLKPVKYEEGAQYTYGSYLILVKNGTVTLNGGTLENLGDGPICYTVEMGDSWCAGSLTVNGGVARAAARAAVVRMYSASETPKMSVTVNGGLIESSQGPGIQYFAPSSSGPAAISITGGEIRAPKYGVYVLYTDGGVMVDMTGGKVSATDADGSAFYFHNKRSRTLDATELNVSGGIVSGDFALQIYDYYAAIHATLSGGNFSGVVCAYTYDEKNPRVRQDDYCVRITGGNFSNFNAMGNSYFYWDNQAATLLYGGTYDKMLEYTFEEGDDRRYTARVAEGYCYRDNHNGTWTVVPIVIPVAEVDGVEYGSIVTAYQNAEAGATITLLADLSLNGIFQISKDIKLNLNGHSYEGLTSGEYPGSFYVINSATFKIVGEGTVKGRFWKDATGRVLLYGGSYDTNVTNYYNNIVADICTTEGENPWTVVPKSGSQSGIEVKNAEGGVEGSVTIDYSTLAKEGLSIDELNDEGRNGLQVWQSVVLSLDPNDATSLPIAKHIQQLDAEKIKVRVSEVGETSPVPEATITYVLYGSNDKTADISKWVRLNASTTPDIVISRGSGFYRYYTVRAEITFDGK